MSSSPRGSFITLVQNKLDEMHPAERRLADFVIDFPGELASYSATELAKLANVSNATVSRFVQKLDFANYDEAKRYVRAERKTGAALFLSSSTPEESAVSSHVAQGQVNLEKTFSGIPQSEIDAVARCMLGAGHVWVIGHRASHSFASYLHWQCLQVIPTISVLPGAGQTMGEYVAGMSKGDCVIVFGLRRRLPKIDLIIRQIVKTGADVLLISDEGMDRQRGPRWHFKCQTAAPGPLFNHVAVLGICHLLATRVIELAGPAGRKRLSAIEASHSELDEL